MTFEELRKKALNFPLFAFSDLLKWFPESNLKTLKLQASNWIKNKKLIQIKKVFIF
jgi:hypothetical protein